MTNTEMTIGTVHGAELAAAARQVAVAAARTHSAYTGAPWTGMRVEVEQDSLTLVSTDRYRLGTRAVALTASTAIPPAPMLFLARDAVEVAKIFKRAETVTLALDSSPSYGDLPALVVDDGVNDEVYLRQLESPSVFPARWRELTPPTADAMAVVDTKALQAAVRQVAREARAAKATVRLAMNSDDEDLKVSVRGLLPPFIYHVHLDEDSGPAVDVDFEPQWLSDGTSAMRGAWTTITFYKTRNYPVGTRQVSFACGGFTYLLMSRRATGPGGQDAAVSQPKES